MQNLRSHFDLRLILSLFALGLGVSAAAGADEHRYVLRADLSGGSCPSDLVIVEATGCQTAAMVDDLVQELVAEGFDERGFYATGCEATQGKENGTTCWYHIPAGCEVERTSITVEAGDSCTPATSVSGSDYGIQVGFHFFAINAVDV